MDKIALAPGQTPSMNIVTIGTRDYFFSYGTCIAFRDGCGFKIRRDQTYSKTTAKHMRLFGVKDWPQVCDAEFERAASC
jgi:hypothetical protein